MTLLARPDTETPLLPRTHRWAGRLLLVLGENSCGGSWSVPEPRCDSPCMATRELTDADLLRAVAGRDEGALRELYDRHALWISARLARRCADRDAVSDVLQDTFIAAWDGASRFRGDG